MGMSRPRPRYSVDRIVADMALRGWNNSDLARAAGVSSMTIGRFLSGQHQTPGTAARIAQALDRPLRRYFSHVEAA